MFSIEHYNKSLKQEWNEFVVNSKNGTFLFDRDYMDYHSDRFEDHSVVIRESNKIIALFPANCSENKIYSHQGLTYGGLIIGIDIKTPEFIILFKQLLCYLNEQGLTDLVYKSIPSIYHRIPSEEDQYALFIENASLTRCDTLSVIDMNHRLAMQSRRLRGVKKARKLGIKIEESESWKEYWSILEVRLSDKHDALPVHSLEEILLLKTKFPKNIRLFTAGNEDQIMAGIVIYETETVVHCQYIAASAEGQKFGALDILFFELIETIFSTKRFFDFGISNEDDGKTLNKGLIKFKEGFGARTLAHRFYHIAL
jgi:hypothetical protein